MRVQALAENQRTKYEKHRGITVLVEDDDGQWFALKPGEAFPGEPLVS